MNPVRRITLAATLALVTFGASAQPVKCVDASGRIRYIDASMAGQEKCKPVQAETSTVPFQSGAGIPSSAPPATRSLADREAALKQARDTLAEIKKWLGIFLLRFFQTSQYKRSAMPNGPKVGSGGSLSPRGDWRAPSDSSAAVWLADLERVPNRE